MAKTTIGDYVTLAAVGAVALLAWKNWGTISSIGSGINSKVTGALQTVNSKIAAAGKE